MSPPDALPGELLVPQPTREEFPDFVSIPIRIARHAQAFPDKRAVVCVGTICFAPVSSATEVGEALQEAAKTRA